MANQYIGQVFGDYKLIKYLGEGGFADVYLGQHIYLHTDEAPDQVAIKLLKGNFTSKEIQELRSEAQIVHRLKHPHIVQLRTFSIAEIHREKIPFLVMEYAPDGSLERLHPRGTVVPLASIVSYVKQIAQALQYVHDQKLVHRDIKPANFLLANDGSVLLSDFGIAIEAHRTASLEAQNLVGSWFYAAPEHFEAKAVPASDQYSLGVVVYQWLTGSPPFKGDMRQLVYQHCMVAPPSLKEQNPTIAAEIEQVVTRSLAKDPKQRFENIQAFAEALEKAYQTHQRKQTILTYQVERDFVLANGKSQTVHVLIEILPAEARLQTRPPLNIAWVLDTSATMKGAKLKSVKEGIKASLDYLNSNDYISLITFDKESHIIIPPTSVNKSLELKTIVDRIDAYSGSIHNRYMSLGMQLGLNALQHWNKPGANSRMMLLTDGETSGDADICQQFARQAASAGIPIYPLGVGSDWNEDLLDNLGHLSGGMPAEFIINPTDAVNLISEQTDISGGLTSTILTLHFAPEVSLKKMLERPRFTRHTDTSVIAENKLILYYDHIDKPKSILLELVMPPQAIGPFRLAQAELLYIGPLLSSIYREKTSKDIFVTFTTDLNKTFESNFLMKDLFRRDDSLYNVNE